MTLETVSFLPLPEVPDVPLSLSADDLETAEDSACHDQKQDEKKDSPHHHHLTPTLLTAQAAQLGGRSIVVIFKL
ncbi:MAG: hypothetical protein ACLTSZ_16435 [Lachnospiraceae bacterium]